MKPPHIKEQRKKEVRKIYKRRRALWKEMRDLGYDKLDKPIRHGWVKEIIILRKVSRYKNEEAILEVFDKIEKSFWGRTKQEANQLWFDQVSKHLIYRDFPTLSKRQFNKLSEKAQNLCTPYRFKTWYKKWKIRFYIRIPKNAYKIKYTRAYITHRRRIDPELESEMALIEQQLLKPKYYNLDMVNFNRKYDYNWRHKEILTKEKLKTKHQLKKLKNFDLNDIIKDEFLLM